MEIDNTLVSIITGAIVALFCGFIGLSLYILDLENLVPLSTFILAGLALFYSKFSFGAKVLILKEDIETIFFPGYGKATITGEYLKENETRPTKWVTLDEKAFIGGSLRIALIFYNEGDRMSIVTIKKVEILNQSLEIAKPDKRFSIEANSHFDCDFGDIRFMSTDHKLPSSIDSLRLTYSWSKKGKIKVTTETFKINCRISE